MEIIGFLLILAIGVAVVIWSIAAAWLSKGLSGQVEKLVIIPFAIGCAIIWIAISNAPFTLTIS